ncbi:MAG: hypothetical protein ACK5GV_01195 [Bacteroidota bacterium]
MLQNRLSNIHEELETEDFSNWPEYKYYALGTKNIISEVLLFIGENELDGEDIEVDDEECGEEEAYEYGEGEAYFNDEYDEVEDDEDEF